jgi:hypothetical protein
VEKYRKQIVPNAKVELIHVSLDDEVADATKWALEGKFPWPTVLAEHYEETGLSEYGAFAGESFLVDSAGKIITKDEKEAFTKISALN